MRRTQSLEIVYVYCSKSPHISGEHSQNTFDAPRPRLLFRGKGLALPLQHTAAPRQNLTRNSSGFVFGCLPSRAFPQAIRGREARGLSSARGSEERFPLRLQLRHARLEETPCRDARS